MQSGAESPAGPSRVPSTAFPPWPNQSEEVPIDPALLAEEALDADLDDAEGEIVEEGLDLQPAEEVSRVFPSFLR